MQQPQRPALRARCQRCHVLGHDTPECRTKDPAMTKKRVAKNARAKKQANLARTVPLQPSTSFAYPFPPYAPFTMPPPTDTFTAMLADATEMRRHAAQS